MGCSFVCGDLVFGGGEGELQLGDLGSEGVAVLEEHVEALGHGGLASVDEVDVVAQVADRHSRRAHAGEEDEPTDRGGVETAVSGMIARDSDQANPLVVAQGVRADVEVGRGGGDVPLGRVVIACEFTQRLDGHASGRVDREPESFVERDVLVHAEHVRGVSALERKGRTTRPANALVPSANLQPC